ncbi:hypothetical protein E2562_005589 [Oryza meyeriana var. granulata]|uniref:Uncharacterized protein n=1 Tax=Oryza meyeriana var. granulata TaxID=110450 RepID=A0A6G1F470_9ORYZ|nr:hypothetical protein E2562_005589 [Oryza meyeriana var. granulata]
MSLDREGATASLVRLVLTSLLGSWALIGFAERFSCMPLNPTSLLTPPLLSICIATLTRPTPHVEHHALE